jgi:hypothetical protein
LVEQARRKNTFQHSDNWHVPNIELTQIDNIVKQKQARTASATTKTSRKMGALNTAGLSETHTMRPTNIKILPSPTQLQTRVEGRSVKPKIGPNIHSLDIDQRNPRRVQACEPEVSNIPKTTLQKDSIRISEQARAHGCSEIGSKRYSFFLPSYSCLPLACSMGLLPKKVRLDRVKAKNKPKCTPLSNKGREPPQTGCLKGLIRMDRKRAQISWRSLKNKHFENKCTHLSGICGIYTTRCGNMKNSSLTYPASNANSTPTCVTNHKSGMDTADVHAPKRPKKP